MNLAQYLYRIYTNLRLGDTNSFSIASMKEIIDESEMIINQETKAIHGTSVINSVSDQREYSYPTDLLDYNIDSIYYSISDADNRVLLTPTRVNVLNEAYSEWRETYGAPEVWYHKEDFSGFGIHPYEENVETGTNCIEINYRQKHEKLTRYYVTGTATFTYNSTAVTGGSTAWASNIVAGDKIGVGALLSTSIDFPVKWYTVSSVTNDTALVLTSAFKESTAASASYISSANSSFDSDLLGNAVIWYATGLMHLINQNKDLADMAMSRGLSLARSYKLKNRRVAADQEPAILRGGYPRNSSYISDYKIV